MVNRYKSAPFVVTSAVPQFSDLGPLSFLVLIDDLESCFKFCHILLYSNDLKLFMKVLTIRDCIKIQQDLDKFAKYFHLKML